MKTIILHYNYVIKAKKRPAVNFSTRAIRNPSADDEHTVGHDTKIQLSKSQIKEIWDSKYVAIEVVNYYKTTSKALIGTPKLTRPDCDNFLKTIGDALNGVLWEDDGKIYKMISSKYWSNRAYSEVIITYGGRYV